MDWDLKAHLESTHGLVSLLRVDIDDDDDDDDGNQVKDHLAVYADNSDDDGHCYVDSDDDGDDDSGRDCEGSGGVREAVGGD